MINTIKPDLPTPRRVINLEIGDNFLRVKCRIEHAINLVTNP